MSFTIKVKEEIIAASSKDKAELSQLSGIVYREGDKSEKENVSFFGIK